MTTRQNVVRAIVQAQDLIGLLKPDLNNNVVIGGSAALILHGLNISRTVKDIDIILYNPTEDQLKALNTLKVLDSQNSQFGYGDRRVVKLNIDQLAIDIIVAKEPLPECLLSLSIPSIRFTKLPIQSIDEVIKAKMSYVKSKEGGASEVYRRSKDFEDLIDLKNSNFNIQ